MFNQMPCITYEGPRKNVRHVLTPLNNSVPLKPKVGKEKVPRNTVSIDWNILMKGILPKKCPNKLKESATSPSIKKTKAGSNKASQSQSSLVTARQTQKMLAKEETGEPSRHTKSLSRDDVKNSSVDYEEQPYKEKTVKSNTVLQADSGQIVEVNGDHKSDSNE